MLNNCSPSVLFFDKIDTSPQGSAPIACVHNPIIIVHDLRSKSNVDAYRDNRRKEIYEIPSQCKFLVSVIVILNARIILGGGGVGLCTLGIPQSLALASP